MGELRDGRHMAAIAWRSWAERRSKIRRPRDLERFRRYIDHAHRTELTPRINFASVDFCHRSNPRDGKITYPDCNSAIQERGHPCGLKGYSAARYLRGQLPTPSPENSRMNESRYVRRSWYEILSDRACEPLHLNLLASFFALFGGYRLRVSFDLVRRRHYAYCTLRAADLAASLGLRSITVAEFGVANGNGLLNLCKVSRAASRITGVEINVVGFDSSVGLPPPTDYRDHPELFQASDYPCAVDELRKALPDNARLSLGLVSETVPEFTASLSRNSPLAFAAIDVDYYSSTTQVLRALTHSDPEKYLPLTLLYLDDITDQFQSRWRGELLAVEEFNNQHVWRKIEKDHFLKYRRIFRNARWLEQIYLLHVLDHPLVNKGKQRPQLLYPKTRRRNEPIQVGR